MDESSELRESEPLRSRLGEEGRTDPQSRHDLSQIGRRALGYPRWHGLRRLNERAEEGEESLQAMVVACPQGDGRSLAVLAFELLKVSLREIVEILGVDRREKPLISRR